MSEIPASEQLAELVFLALDHGIESVRDGGPLTPFAVTEASDGERALTRFVAETLEGGYSTAREHVAKSDAERAVVARDGYLTVEGVRTDAIFVEGQERGERQACIVFAQRYRPGGRLRKFQTIGNAAFVGDGDPLF